MALAAFGVCNLAPLQLSESLEGLNVSHSSYHRDGLRISHKEIVCGLEQPAWPMVFDSLKTFIKLYSSFPSDVEEKAIYFVIDARAALSNTNLNMALWPENLENNSFDSALRFLLTESTNSNHMNYSHKWSLNVRAPSIMDYVNAASKPSVLTDLQSLIYKINPYQLRKEVQRSCICYLASKKGFNCIKEFKHDPKLSAIYQLMISDKIIDLKNAVSMTKKMSVDKVAKMTGFQTFELMYLIKSSSVEDKV